MATLSETNRLKVWRGLMRWWSAAREETPGISKHELKDAVDATDDWIESNQAGFNNALPEPVKSNLSQAQKTLIFCAVAIARVSIEFLRKILGEVN